MAEVLALRGAMIEGVIESGTLLDGRVAAGQIAPDDASGWRLGMPIDQDGRLRFVARGHGEEARELVMYLVRLAQRRGGTLTAAPGGLIDPERPRRSRIDELMRQATFGAMAGAVLHDVAGIIQGIGGAILQLTCLAEERNDEELLANIQEIRSAGDEAVELFVAMRKYMRDGKPTLREVEADDLVQRTMRQVGGVARERANVRVAKCPRTRVRAAEPLFVQVLGAVIRNAASASPQGGDLDVEVEADGEAVRFVVTDDGPGVDEEVAGLMFEACVWHRPEHVGTGLSIAAHALAAQGGQIEYRRAPGRGARFTISLPRVP
jgi:signal transduction histidine kinase